MTEENKVLKELREEVLNEEALKYLREHKVLDYIRKNVSLERIEKVEKVMGLEGDFGKYLNETLMESVYSML